jgi:hypothetical protein
MLAYEVFLNGARLCLSGIDGDGVLNAMLSYGKGKQVDHLHLSVGGLASVSKETLQWACADLRVGDELKINVIDAESVDEPTTREPAPEFDLDVQKANTRAWIKKLGWTVIENPDGA